MSVNKSIDFGPQWKLSPWVPPLIKNEIHLWGISLPTYQNSTNQLFTFLSSEEQSKAQKFPLEKIRTRFIVTHGLLRFLLNKYLNNTNITIQIIKDKYGKLKLKDPPLLHFSITHSDEIILLAFSRERVLGVDVEKLRPQVPYLEIAERFFSHAEFQTIKQALPEKQIDLFYDYWTLKEAYLKGKGTGFYSSLKDLKNYPSQKAQDWSFLRLTLNAFYKGALAISGKEGWTPRYLRDPFLTN